MPTGTPSPTETPFVAPPALDSTVPPNTPVLYYTRYDGGSNNGGLVLDAVDWSGAARGRILVPGMAMSEDGNAVPAIQQSPDGERLVVGDDVYASTGTHLYQLPSDPRRLQSATWADDSRHLCFTRSEDHPEARGFLWSVEVFDSGGHVQRTLQLPDALGGESGYQIAACAVAGDRLAVYRQVGMSTPLLLVVRISSGAVLLRQSLCGDAQCNGAPLDALATLDARHGAESRSDGPVRVRDLVTGRAIALREQGRVLAISHDGTRLLIGPPDFQPDAGRIVLVDVASDRVLWSRANAQSYPQRVATSPAGRGLAVAWQSGPFPSPAADGRQPLPTPATLTLLLDDGPRDVATNVYLLWQ